MQRQIVTYPTQLKKAYELAEVNSRSTQAEQKKLYDRRIQGAFLEIGDRVLVRNVGLKGTNKIADKWSEQVYFVVSQPNPDIPVYEVKPEIGRSRVKVLHRNLLLPIPCLPVQTPKADPVNVKTTPAVIAEENRSVSGVTSVSDVRSEVSFTIRPRRAPVPAPRKTRPGTPDGGRMAETIPSPEREPSVDETVEQFVLEDSSSVPEQGTHELTNSVSNSPVLDEESDSELSENQVGLESDGTIFSSGEEMDRETVPKAIVPETDETGSETVLETEEPPIPAPRRSARIKSKTHLRPDFAYDFAQTANSKTVRETQMHRDAIQKVKFLKEFVKLL